MKDIDLNKLLNIIFIAVIGYFVTKLLGTFKGIKNPFKKEDVLKKHYYDVSPEEFANKVKFGYYKFFGIKKWASEPFHKAWDKVYKTIPLKDRMKLEKLHEELKRVNGGAIGIYNKRKINGTDKWSKHAYGCALDLPTIYFPVFDHGKKYEFAKYINIRSGRGYTQFDKHEVRRLYLELINTMKNSGLFKWGGDFHNFYDPMHIELKDDVMVNLI